MKARCSHSLSRMLGFSLVELMVVLAIASIFLAIGLPGFSTLIQNQRMTTAVNDFVMSINLARAEAIHQGVRIDLVPIDGAEWRNGWVVFADQNNNQSVDHGEKMIFSHGPVAGGMAIKSVFTDSAKPYLAYNSSGRSQTNAGSQAPQFGTVSFFLNEKTRRIKLNFLGRPRTCNPENDRTCTGANNEQ